MAFSLRARPFMQRDSAAWRDLISKLPGGKEAGVNIEDFNQA